MRPSRATYNMNLEDLNDNDDITVVIYMQLKHGSNIQRAKITGCNKGK